MKTFVLVVAMSMVSSIALARGGDNVNTRSLYDENGNEVAIMVEIPPGCQVVPPQAGSDDAVIFLCNEEVED
jgi:hypothetical protein